MNIIERLEELAVQTRIRVGIHPDYHLINETISLIKQYESKINASTSNISNESKGNEPEDAPKPIAKTKRKRSS